MALDFGKLNFSTSFNPTSAFPIDARTYFESYEAAVAAAATAEAAGSSNTTYYIGQIFTVYEGGEVSAYQVTAAKALQKLASTTASGDLASDVATLQSQVGALQTAMNTAESDIAGIKDGTTAVGKATADADGNNIAETYETKANVTAIAGNVGTLQTTVGEHTTDIAALEANVGTLQTTVGGAGSGLVKDVNDLKSQIGGLSGAMHFVGTSTTDPTGGTVTIGGKPEYASAEGDVVLYGNKEYVYNGTAWVELGDEGSFVLKTTTVNGKPLSANVTLNATDVGADPTGTASSLIAKLNAATVTVGANKTIASIAQNGGVITATPVEIAIEQSQVNGLTAALANVATGEALANATANITALQGNVSALQTEVGTKVNATQVANAIANATIEATKINGTVANASYATQAGSLVQSLTINVNGTATSFNGGEAATVNITFPTAPTYNGVGAVSVTANGSNYDVAVAANGILTSMIADGQITTAKIAANAVTKDKIASVSTDAFVQGDNELVLNGGTASD